MDEKSYLSVLEQLRHQLSDPVVIRAVRHACDEGKYLDIIVKLSITGRGRPRPPVIEIVLSGEGPD